MPGSPAGVETLNKNQRKAYPEQGESESPRPPLGKGKNMKQFGFATQPRAQE